MKIQVFFLISFFLVSLPFFGQNVTFEQAQNLRKKPLAEVESFLVAKKWEMTEAMESSDDKMGKAVFGYGVNQFDNEKALAWIIYYESSYGANFNRLTIQVHKQSVYSVFLARLAPNGYKLKKTKIIDGGIEKVYKNATTTCVVTTGTTEGPFSRGSAYSFFFIDNISYQLQFEDDE